MPRPKKIKKIIDSRNATKERIQKTFTKAGKPVMPKHVLKINDWLYITCDKCSFKLVEVNNTINAKTGKKNSDIPFLYAPHLDQILEVLVHYMSRDMPRDIVELDKQLQDIKELIMARIPADIKPKDLFEEYNMEEDSNE